MSEKYLEKGICSSKTGVPLEFKIKVIQELKKGHLTKAQISRKYGIKRHSTVSIWRLTSPPNVHRWRGIKGVDSLVAKY